MRAYTNTAVVPYSVPYIRRPIAPFATTRSYYYCTYCATAQHSTLQSVRSCASGDVLEPSEAACFATRVESTIFVRRVTRYVPSFTIPVQQTSIISYEYHTSAVGDYIAPRSRTSLEGHGYSIMKEVAQQSTSNERKNIYVTTASPFLYAVDNEVTTCNATDCRNILVVYE